jgi:conjugative relaxase-like TrwC/TraI family protein
MLSIASLGKAGSKDSKGKGPVDYYKEVELGKIGYYHGKDGKEIETAPVWSGKGAAKLGLVGAVDPDFKAVEMLARGLGPNGENIGIKGTGDRHKVGDDFTFSANKSVSLAFMAADDELQRGILEDFREATHTAIAYLERNAITRTGKDGVDRENVKGITCAVFQHFASRELDPQLHAHVLMFNAAERQDGKFGTLDGAPFYALKMTAGALWRADLANRLAERGFEIAKDAKDNFKIVGIKQEWVDEKSTRRQQILAELNRKGQSGAQASQNATFSTRRVKDEPPLPQMMETWKKDGIRMGLDETYVQDMVANGKSKPRKRYELDKEKLISALTEQRSTFESQDVVKAIAIDAVGHWNMAQIEKAAEEILKSEEILHLGKGRDPKAPARHTTAERYELEKTIGLSAERRMEETYHRVDAGVIERAAAEQAKKQGFKLNAEQRAAVDFICKDTGGMACVEGWAGTGKTTMLTTVNEVFKAQGLKLFGTAIAAKAATGLQNEAGIPSQTLESLLMQLEKGSKKLDADTVIVVDEAGMVGSRMFRRLQAQADEAGSKLVLVGDPKQLQAIEAGGIMRSLMDRVGKVELQDINRQKSEIGALRSELKGLLPNGERVLSPLKRHEIKKVKNGDLVAWAESLAKNDDEVASALARWKDRSDYAWLRGTVKDFANDGADGKGLAGKALREFDSRGLLALGDSRKETVQNMVLAWAADHNENKGKLMIAGTNEEVFQINAAARLALQDQGKLKTEQEGFLRVNLTKSGSSYRDFVEGDRVVFKKNNRAMGVQNGMLGTVESIDGGRLRVRLDSDHGPGKVAIVDPKKYNEVDHGYCVSTNKAQGVTINSCYVYVSESMADREWSYVAASRSRYKTMMFATEGDVSHLMPDNYRKMDKAQRSAMEKDKNIEQMGARMGRSHAKDTTLDYKEALTHSQLEAKKAEGQSAKEQKRKEEQRKLAQEARRAAEEAKRLGGGRG